MKAPLLGWIMVFSVTPFIAFAGTFASQTDSSGPLSEYWRSDGWTSEYLAFGASGQPGYDLGVLVSEPTPLVGVHMKLLIDAAIGSTVSHLGNGMIVFLENEDEPGIYECHNGGDSGPYKDPLFTETFTDSEMVGSLVDIYFKCNSWYGTPSLQAGVHYRLYVYPWSTAHVRRVAVAMNAEGTKPYYEMINAQESTTVCTSECYSNVLFLPGIEGSRLYEQSAEGEQRLWEPSSDADAGKLALNADGSSAYGVYAKHGEVLDEVCVAAVCPNIYKAFVEHMDKLKQQGVMHDWQPLAYDWRLSFEQLLSSGLRQGERVSYLSATNTPYLIAEVERLSKSSKSGKVTIIAHSNGGLLAKALLQKLEPDASRYVDKLILVASPQLGTPDTIPSILHGNGLSIPFSLSEEEGRAVVQYMPGAYNLLPSNTYFTNVDDPVIEFDKASLPDWVSRYGEVVHSTERLRNFMTDTTREVPARSDLVTPTIASSVLTQKSFQVHEVLDAWTPPEGIKVYAIAGWGSETLKGIRYRKVATQTCVQYVQGTCAAYGLGSKLTFDPQMTIDGDGTVVEPSALWGNHAPITRYWVDLKEYNSQLIAQTPLGAKSHRNILEISSLLELLENLIKADGNSSTPKFVKNSQPNAPYTKRISFVLHSPLTLGFRDISGNYTGATATTTTFHAPNVTYKRFGDVQLVSIPADISGTLEMSGIEEGSFSLDMEYLDGKTTSATSSFQAVPSTDATKAKLEVVANQSPTSSSTLMVDVNGDGAIRLLLHAKTGTVVTPDLNPPEILLTPDVTRQDVSIDALDESATTIEMIGSSTTKLTDSFNNTTTFVWNKTIDNKGQLIINLLSVQYGNQKPKPITASIKYVWGGPNAPVTERLEIGQKKVQAIYNQQKNQSNIFVWIGDVLAEHKTLPGRILLKIVSNKGAIDYKW